MSLAVQGRKKNSIKTNAGGLKTPKRLINGSNDTTKGTSFLNNPSKYPKNVDQVNVLNKLRRFDQERNGDVKKEPGQLEQKAEARSDENKGGNLVELDMDNLSPDEIKQREKYFDGKLKDLSEKLKRVHDIGVLCGESLSDLKENEMGESVSLFLKEYLFEMEKLERDCEDRLESLSEWYEREKEEVDETYKTEKKKAVQEFHDKRKELKDNLINENEEIRKQIEIDRNTLDINMDTAEIKPPPTRNLRRRTNHNNNENDTSNHDLSSSHIGLHVSSSVSSSSGLMQSTSVSLSTSGNLTTNNILGSSQTNFYSVQQNFYSSSTYSQYVNDRKRKFTPNMMFQLCEDDLNDDLKFLSKSLRVSHCQ